MNTQQEIQLRDDLRQLVADHPVGPDIDMAIRRAHRVRRRGIALRGAAGLGVVALAAGAVVIGTRGAPGTAAKNSAAKNSPASQAETVAYVIKHTDAALANVSHYIVRDDVTSPSGAFTLWTDPRTGNTYLEQGSGSGRLAAWGSTYLTGNVLHWRTVQVNYGPRTWWSQVIHAAGPIQGAPPAGPYGGPGGTPAQIKAWLASGQYKIIGHRDIDGHKATGLRRPWAHGYLEVWVDSATFQPVRVIMADFAYEPGLLRNDANVYDESWISRTSALVNLVNHPQIPAGFTQVPAALAYSR